LIDSRDRVVVHLDTPELGGDQVAGALVRERAGTQSVISFSYEPEWVAAENAFALDPSLFLYEGEQYSPALPGIFADAAPDRWGRTLLERREAVSARREGRAPRQLDDWDFLVGVNDRARMGALRIARASDGAFLDDEPLTIPPLARLRELEHWASEVERGLPEAGSEEERWIAMLIAPGSSLGGARPKANYVEEDGALWIAKFPSRDDRHDFGAWEFVTARLASRAGIEIPEPKLLALGATYRTYCARRFDRRGGERRLFASAMTLTGRRDNEPGAGYPDIVRAIESFGDPTAIETDLEQLFRRLAFNVIVANHDDHLRNHGFLRTAAGWRLAPAFDVNPSPYPGEHSLSIDGSVHASDLDTVLGTADLYRLGKGEAEQIIAQVCAATANWRAEAAAVGLPREELERMSVAFERHGADGAGTAKAG
jgi:serine/threonine-protein kinase HipA